ncbi:RHS repeat-associated protein [Chitinophaga dinghuensis]|uniref:RHS repeat-associated protein n=1 Tax=Chitinophaga dinghuensis TaxID=1539050 RepID=A0A327VP80_9BACT|nr:RHS repeat-associated core domain-containing protein [Chitinophaga dinghuensis]RAJ75643.1 RHS repeat-associated protein [Chitinophaga dinghuensis]
MKPYIRLSHILFLLFTAVLLPFTVFSQGKKEIAIVKMLDGAKGQLVKDSVATLKDAVYFDPSLKAKLTPDSRVRNIITLRMNEFSRRVLPVKFTAKVNVRIFYSKDGVNESSVDKELAIDYDTLKPYSLRSSFIFENAHSVKVQVLQVTTNDDSKIVPTLILENEMRILPRFIFSCTADVVKTITASPSNTEDEDRLQVSWPAVATADVYDLEWTFVDSSAIEAKRYGTPVKPGLVFNNNATRITTAATSYDIPLLYGKVGVLYYRVRAVQENSETERIPSSWSSDFSGGFGEYTFNGHQRNLNWQAAVSFAEEGKRKVAANYFDGSLKQRQSAAIDNTTNKVIVTEQLYDLQGRPVIQVLPAPTTGSVLKFNPLVNTALNGAPYEKKLYEHINAPVDNLTAYAPPMDSSSGTAQYYSSLNPNINEGNNRFIPRANGYVFSETVFEPDGSGRVRKQGGLGEQYRIGSGHESLYYYSGASQQELDAMFGTEVGVSSHYFKNAIVDANGQLSVAYLDMQGRTVASALAGKPSDTSLLDLDNVNAVYLTEDLTNDHYDERSQEMQLHESRLVPEKGVYHFKYDLTPPVLQLPNCKGEILAYPGLYDLEIKITDDSWNQHLGGQPYKITASNYTSSYQLKDDGRLQFDFELELERGAYEITRTLTINKRAMDYYRDSIYFKSSACYTIDKAIEEQKAKQRDACNVTCDDCPTGNDRVGTDDIRQMMLADMTPPYGQYALTNDTTSIYSIFYLDHKVAPPYQRTGGTFLDANGGVASIYDPVTGKFLSPDKLDPYLFISNFEPQWANVLLKLHPEFCRLGIYEQNRDAQKWIRDFENTDTYFAAQQAGYLTPTDGKTKNPDPLIKLAAKSLSWRFASNQKILVGSESRMASMWEMAAISVKCDNTAACMNKYKNATPATLEGALCGPDLDMVWRSFRGAYINAHQNVLDSLAAVYCTVAANKPDKLLAAGKEVRFPTATTLMQANNLTGVENSVKNSADPSAEAQAQMMAVYYRDIENMAATWMEQLAPCKFSPSALAEIKQQLLIVCKAGADATHPFGASTVKPGANTVYKSFEEVLNAYTYAKGIKDPLICNSELITAPKPYDVTIKYTDIPTVTKPKDCECDNLKALVTEYKTFKQAGDVNLSAYVNRVKHVAIPQSTFDDMQLACDQTNTECQYLPKAINIPVMLQCTPNPSCVSCDRVKTLDAQFKAAYPGLTPVYQDTDENARAVNLLYATYMNNRLGFSSKAWEYLSFMEECANGTGTTQSICVPGGAETKQMLKVYNAGEGVDKIEDIHETSTGLIMAGSTRITGGSKDAYVVSTDKSGNLIWSRTYGGEADDELNRLIPTADGYIGIGTTYSSCLDNGAIFLLKLDADGNTIWNKTVDFAEYGAKGMDIGITADGNYAFTGIKKSNSANTHWIAGVLSPDGDMKWMNQTDYGETGPYLGLVASNDTLFTAGSINYGQGMQPVLVGYNLTTGEQIYRRKYSLDKANTVRDFVKLNNGFLMACEDGVSNHFIKLTPLGTPMSIVEPPAIPGEDLTNVRITGTTDGGFLISRSGQDIWWQKFDAQVISSWINQVVLPGNEVVRKVVQLKSGAFAGGGNQDGKALLVSGNASGKTGCYDNRPTQKYNIVMGHDYAESLLQPVPVNDLAVNTLAIGEVSKYIIAKSLNCPGIDSCYLVGNSMMCGAVAAVFPTDTTAEYTPCTDSSMIANAKGEEIYNYYKDSLTYDFQRLYVQAAKNLRNREQFTVGHESREYQYTLYYYDQAGNLVKTIPPAGARVNKSQAWFDQVADARAKGERLVPAHEMATDYRYNSINVVVERKSPDAGIARIWHDRLGRMIALQSAQQKLDNKYTYTLYDDLGRITEVGQLTNPEVLTTDISKNSVLWSSWFAAAGDSREQIRRTKYDIPYPFMDGTDWNATNLRNRVSWTAMYPTIQDTIAGQHATATYYSYDIHGNVKTLMQDYRSGMASNSANRFKKMAYSYDLISGKVNTFSYQLGMPDAFYHRYKYDADNKLIKVETSKDSVYWENDANYAYYEHGLLSRIELGEAQVQGVDYAYNFLGLLKGVNSTVIGEKNDMGKDGSATSLTAKDAFGFSLHYNNNDYDAIGGTSPMAGVAVAHPLYNGNIAAMAVNLPKVGEPLLYNYRYDLLGRIKNLGVSKNLDTVINKWNPIPVPDFAESITYDDNGNILKYDRNGNATWANKSLDMDKLTYHYIPGTNQLRYIADAVAPDKYAEDIDSQEANNYQYDADGNLIADQESDIKRVKWTVDGKVAEIEKSNGSLIKYTYDVAGNRISKYANGIETRYIRDGNGNVMSVYTTGDASINNGLMSQTEIHLYGSQRLGINNYITKVEQSDLPETTPLPGLGTGYVSDFKRGFKYYELSNHLGNVLATVADNKLWEPLNDTMIGIYIPRIISSQDYAPFGMGLVGRGYSTGMYRYGFNGHENDTSIDGRRNVIDFGARIFDPRTGRFLSMDPKTSQYPALSPYLFANASPIAGIDKNGEDYGYAFLYNMARTTRSLVTVSLSASGGIGIAFAGAIGMGVDPRGNVIIYYGISGGGDKTLVNRKAEWGVAANVNLSLSFGALAGDWTGAAFSIGGGKYKPLGAGGSLDFGLKDNNKGFYWSGFTLSGGFASPGSGYGNPGLAATFGVVYSRRDYKILFETDWDKMGQAESESLNSKIDFRNPVGMWRYLGSEEVHTRQADGSFTVQVKQRFFFSISGLGAKLGEVDKYKEVIRETGITLIQADKMQLRSKSYDDRPVSGYNTKEDGIL